MASKLEIQLEEWKAEKAKLEAKDEHGNWANFGGLWGTDFDGYYDDGVTKNYDTDEEGDHESMIEHAGDVIAELERLIASGETEMADANDGVGVVSELEEVVELGTGQNTDIIEEDLVLEQIHINGSSQVDHSKQVDIRPNKLHTLASYSVQYDFYMMTFEDYNNLQETLISTNPTDDFSTLAFNFSQKEERLLISSKGVTRQVSAESSNHNIHFRRNYHIDDINIDSYIGTNGHAGAKVTNVTMKVNEPYGATLIENLIKAAVGHGSKWYIEMPYMLKISFKGWDANGESKTLTDSTKYLLLKIGDINFNVTENGSEYSLMLYRYSDGAFAETVASIPTDIQVNSSTVGDFFGFTKVGATGDASKTGISDIMDVEQDNYQGAAFGVTEQAQDIKNSFKNFPAIMNRQWDEKLGGIKPDYPDEYSFSIDQGCGQEGLDAFLKATVVKKDAKGMAGQAIYTNKLQAAGISEYTGNIQAKNIIGSESVQLTRGISILNAMKTIISSSSFMTDQVTVTPGVPQLGYPSTYKILEGTKDKPIWLYKITSVVTVGNWDDARGQYQKKIKYVVTLHHSHGNSPDSLPEASASDVVKEYKWIYTGQNKDVLGFDMDFGVAALSKKLIGGYAEGLEGLIDKHPTSVSASAIAGFKNAEMTREKETVHVPFDHRGYYLTRNSQSDWTAGSKSDYRTVMAENFMSKIYSKGVDTMTGELTIVGDPDFITQDEGFGLSANNSLYINGSINTHKDATIHLTFMTPPDINTDTGLMETHSGDKDNNYGNSISTFSGFYRVMLITTTIVENQFKQVLEIQRIKNQEPLKPPQEEATLMTKDYTQEKYYEGLENIGVEVDDDVTEIIDSQWGSGTAFG